MSTHVSQQISSGVNSLQGKSSTAWYALWVRSSSEQLVAKMLEVKGIECYAPSVRSVRTWSDRIKEIQTPLFPGYVFAKFDCRNRLPILKTPAVVEIVGFNQKYLPVSEVELSTVRRVLESRASCEPWPYLEVGQRVLVESGPLAGLEGLLLEVKQSRRMVVSISLLQRSVNVELDPAWVTRVPDWSRPTATSRVA